MIFSDMIFKLYNLLIYLIYLYCILCFIFLSTFFIFVETSLYSYLHIFHYKCLKGYISNSLFWINLDLHVVGDLSFFPFNIFFLYSSLYFVSIMSMSIKTWTNSVRDLVLRREVTNCAPSLGDSYLCNDRANTHVSPPSKLCIKIFKQKYIKLTN